MIPINNTEKPVVSHDFKDVGFDIDERGKAHIFNVLRNQLYTNKPLAVLREYSTNAVDAHFEAGCADKPIEITLPNVLEPVLKIRDFGFGLSESDIQNVYCKYGASTKRASNEMIGQLGLGCKSGFAYGENFVVVSYHGGEETTYNAYLDESQIGRIAKLNSQPSTQPNGVEIQIPIKKNDLELFAQIAKNLFSYFKVAPVVKGRANFEITRYDTSIIAGTDWRLAGNYGQAIAVMGNIGYPLDSNALRAEGVDSWMKTYIAKNFIIDFKIGSLEIAANREGLQYTDHTIKAIKARLNEVRKELCDTLNKDFAACDTMYKAKALYFKMYDYGSPLYGLNELAKQSIKFKGVTVDNNQYHIDYAQEGFRVVYYSRGHRHAVRIRPEQVNRLLCSTKRAFVLNDANITNGVLNRLAALVERPNNALGYQCEGVYLITVTDQAKYDQWVKDVVFDAPITNISTLPAFKLSEIYPSSAAGAIKNSKHSLSVFTLDTDCKHNFRRSPLSDFYKTATVDLDNDSGLYIVIDRFEAVKPSKYMSACNGEPHALIAKIKEICALTGEAIPVVYAVKVKEQESIGDNFQCLFEWMAEKLENHVTVNNIAQVAVDRRAFCYNESHVLKEIHRMNPPVGSLAFKAASAYNVMQHTKQSATLDVILKLVSDFGIELEKNTPPKHDLAALKKEFFARYPMIKIGGERMFDWGYDKAESDTFVLEYIKLIESQHAPKI